MPVRHCKRCGGRLTVDGVCNNPRCHRPRGAAPLSVKSVPSLAGSPGSPRVIGTTGEVGTSSPTVSGAMARFAMLKSDVTESAPAEKPVRRKAPPDIKRDTPEWDAFEREYCTTAIPASEDKAHAMATVLHSGQTDQVGMDTTDTMGLLDTGNTGGRNHDSEPMSESVRPVGKQPPLLQRDTPVWEGFASEKVIDAIDGVSKRDGEATDAYFERVRSNPISWALKIGDHLDNTDEDRRQNLLGSPKHPVAPDDLNPDGTMKKDGKIPPFDRLGIKYVAASRSLQIEIPENLRRYA